MFSIWIYSIPLLVTLCVPGTYLDSSGVKKFQGTDQLKVSQRLCGTQCFLSFNPLLYTWCRLRAHHLGGTLRGLGWPCWMATWNPVRGSFAGIFAKSLSWTRQWATGRFSTGIPYLLTSGWTRHFLRYSFTIFYLYGCNHLVIPDSWHDSMDDFKNQLVNLIVSCSCWNPKTLLFGVGFSSLQPVPTLCPFQILWSELEESERNLRQQKDLEMVDWGA